MIKVKKFETIVGGLKKMMTDLEKCIESNHAQVGKNDERICEIQAESKSCEQEITKSTQCVKKLREIIGE